MAGARRWEVAWQVLLESLGEAWWLRCGLQEVHMARTACE